jgi:thymidylate synthase
MSKWDIEYLKLCKKILTEGQLVSNRTGIDVLKVPHQILTFDLQDEFPILTTKFVAFKHAVLEMMWIFQVQSNDARWLQERGIKIWNEWQIDEEGCYQGKYFGKEYAHTIGTAYGYVVDKYKQMDDLIDKLKNNPNDRRKIISLWQNAHLDKAALPSCVWSSQWDVTKDELNCLVNQRSCDVALGLPFNVTQYAILTHMLAQVSNLKVGKLTWVINDAHIYVNQIEGINEQISKEDKAFPAPTLVINKDIKDFYSFDNSKELKDIKLENYQHNGKILMKVAI